RFLLFSQMGGDLVRTEPANLEGVTPEAMALFDSKGFTPFLKIFEGHYENLSKDFSSTWKATKKGAMVEMKGIRMEITVDSVEKVMGIPVVGREVYKPKKEASEELNLFLK
ncbi:hypothetical protein KI387_042732, partial [Taxus chinensis]